MRSLDERPLNVNDTNREGSQLLEHSLAEVQASGRAVLRGASVGDSGSDALAAVADAHGATALGGAVHHGSVHGHDHVVGGEGSAAGADRVGEPGAAAAEGNAGVGDDVRGGSGDDLGGGDLEGTGVADSDGDGGDHGQSGGDDSEFVDERHVGEKMGLRLGLRLRLR